MAAGHLDARHPGKRRQQRHLLADVGRIRCRGVAVAGGGAAVLFILVEPSLERQQEIDRAERGHHEHRRRRQPGDHFEDADRAVTESIQRRNGRVLQEVCESPWLRAVAENVLPPRVDRWRRRGRRLSAGAGGCAGGRQQRRAEHGCHECSSLHGSPFSLCLRSRIAIRSCDRLRMAAGRATSTNRTAGHAISPTPASARPGVVINVLTTSQAATSMNRIGHDRIAPRAIGARRSGMPAPEDEDRRGREADENQNRRRSRSR